MPVLTISGPWDQTRIDEYLASATIPLRLASAGRSSPMVQSMWFAWSDRRLWCATQEDAVIVRRLRADNRCGFEVAGDQPPYRGVRGSGTAEIVTERAEPVLRSLLDRYRPPEGLQQWLLSRLATEVAIAITPTRLTTWDFTERMS